MKTSPSIRRVALVVAAVMVGFLLILYTGLQDERRSSTIFERNISFSAQPPHRKLLHQPEALIEPNRIWGEKCSKSDIVVSQGPTAPLPNGIPTYTVEVMNVCVTGCNISGIHLNCGWFSSARLINPHVFKRLRYNDCLVNDGKPLANGATLSFQYANTFLYPLAVSSIVC